VVPLEILDRRLVKKGNKAVSQVLIRSSNIPQESATWEEYYVLRQKFPDAGAWGQADSVEGANMTTTEVGTVVTEI
jgi:hypothetical protein